jgi:hypothetical protein
MSPLLSLGEQVNDARVTCSWNKVGNILDRPQTPGGVLTGCNSSQRASGSFVSVSLKEALDMAENGWTEGAQAAEKHPQYAELFAQAYAPSVRWGFDPEEGEVVWDRLLSGAETYLQRPKIATGFTKACRVIVSGGCSCGISEASMLQRAIDIAAGLYQLEQQRIATELWVTCLSQGYPLPASAITFKVHTTGDVFNLGKIAFFCGHSGLLRRIVFAVQERASKAAQDRLGTHYGMPGNLDPKTLSQLNLPPWEGTTLLLPTLRDNSIETTRKKILNAFNHAVERLQDSTVESAGTIISA